MRRALILATALACVLSACAQKPAAPASTAPLTIAGSGGSAGPPPAGCPPLQDRSPFRGTVRITVDPKPLVPEPDEPLHLTVRVENRAPFPATVNPPGPVVELRPLAQGRQGPPLWHASIDQWAGVALTPGEQRSAELTWPGGGPGYYLLAYSGDVTIPCQGEVTLGSSGVPLLVRPPAGSVHTGRLEPGTVLTAAGHTVRVEAIEMDQERTRVTVWVSGLHPRGSAQVNLYWDKGGTPVGMLSRSIAGAEGGLDVIADFEPTPIQTRRLVIQVSDVSPDAPDNAPPVVDPGTWRLPVTLP